MLPALFLHLLRFLLTLSGIGATIVGAIFIIVAFTKIEKIFSRAELYAGFAFIVCGIALLTWARRRLSEEIRAAELLESAGDGVELSDVPRTDVWGGLIAVSLLLPVLAGIVLVFVPSIEVSLAISITAVVASSALVAVDASRLETIDRRGRPRESAVRLFVGMCLLWIVGYPFAFFRRQHFCGPNLGFVAVGVALFFCCYAIRWLSRDSATTAIVFKFGGRAVT